MKKTLYSGHSEIVISTLIKMRNDAGLTQRELATRLEKAQSFVAKYELGERRIDIVEFYSICIACDASPLKETAKLIREFLKLEGA